MKSRDETAGASRVIADVCGDGSLRSAHASKIQTPGERVIIDVAANVAAKREIVWDVLTGPTNIEHHGEYVRNARVPPVVVPAMIETETRNQYTQLIAEMLRRAALK